MVTLHHLNNSRSQRILWLLEELGIDYDVKRYERDAVTNLAPASLRAIHPLGRSPVLTEGDTTIAESGAIVDYLVQMYGKDTFAPPTDKQDYQQYLFWVHFAEGSLMPPLVALMILEKARVKASKMFFIKPIADRIVDGIISAYYGPNLTQSLAYIEAYLEQNEWFAGSTPNAADVQMIFPLEAIVASGKAKDLPAIAAYVKRVHERDAYQRALKKGGEYAYA